MESQQLVQVATFVLHCTVFQWLIFTHLYISLTNVIASNKADGKEESNQFQVTLIISNGRLLLERSKSKSDGKIGEESKFEWTASMFEMHISYWERRLRRSSRRCSQQKKEKTDRKNERISAGWTGEEMVKFPQEYRMKDQHSRRYALFFQEHGSC